jgi:hypothetical protein
LRRLLFFGLFPGSEPRTADWESCTNDFMWVSRYLFLWSYGFRFRSEYRCFSVATWRVTETREPFGAEAMDRALRQLAAMTPVILQI